MTINKLNMYKSILFCILLSLFTGCQQKGSSNLEDVISKCVGKEFVSNNDFLLYYKESNADFVIINYIDTEGCSSCKLQTNIWNKFLNNIRSNFPNVKIDIVYVVTSGKVRIIKDIFNDDEFIPNAVISDTNDSILHLNKIPNNFELQTYLIDKNGIIQVIGNPHHFKNIKKLYYKKFAGNDTINIQDSLNTTVLVDPMNINLGVIHRDSITVDVEILNIGDNPLYIDELLTSCDCTKATVSSDTIIPGHKTILNIKLIKEGLGDFFRTVEVFGNVKDGSFTIEVEGHFVEL